MRSPVQGPAETSPGPSASYPEVLACATSSNHLCLKCLLSRPQQGRHGLGGKLMSSWVSAFIDYGNSWKAAITGHICQGRGRRGSVPRPYSPEVGKVTHPRTGRASGRGVHLIISLYGNLSLLGLGSQGGGKQSTARRQHRPWGGSSRSGVRAHAVAASRELRSLLLLAFWAQGWCPRFSSVARPLHYLHPPCP